MFSIGEIETVFSFRLIKTLFFIMDGKIKCYFSVYQVRTNERAELTFSMNGTKSDKYKRKTEKHKSVK